MEPQFLKTGKLKKNNFFLLFSKWVLSKLNSTTIMTGSFRTNRDLSELTLKVHITSGSNVTRNVKKGHQVRRLIIKVKNIPSYYSDPTCGLRNYILKWILFRKFWPTDILIVEKCEWNQ